MKQLFSFLIGILLISSITSCERYEEVSEPTSYMGGSKWTFIDYDIVIVSAIGPVTVIKSDTICINSFNNQSFVSGGILMSQNYKQTSIARRFIKNKTQWEFDGYHLYCDWIVTPNGMGPSHEPFWVSYPKWYYENYSIMQISDLSTGSKTTYTFKTNNYGAAPPSQLILESPDIVTDLYSSSGERQKAVTVRVILTFMR
jgi:hypothetical protein